MWWHRRKGCQQRLCTGCAAAATLLLMSARCPGAQRILGAGRELRGGDAEAVDLKKGKWNWWLARLGDAPEMKKRSVRSGGERRAAAIGHHDRWWSSRTARNTTWNEAKKGAAGWRASLTKSCRG